MAQSFGVALRMRRRDAGLTQRDLAERAGLDFTYISKLENDRLPPPAADTVVLLCRILGTPPEEMLALTGKIPSEVQQMMSSSSAAQEFLREAQQRGISETEWRQLASLLRSLKEEPDHPKSEKDK
jgi:HTH-type transcriptional regulator, competence development regulator